MAIDIVELIFVDFLQMSNYAVMSTGNILHDLIMLLFLPTILIILVVYQAVGRVLKNPGLRLLVGIGLYMFIIVEGFYQMFAYFAKAYFIFLLFIVGLLFFLPSHFAKKEGGKERKPRGRGGGERGERGSIWSRHMPTLSPSEQDALRQRERDLKKDLELAEKQYEKALEQEKADKAVAEAQTRINEIHQELREINRKLRGG